MPSSALPTGSKRAGFPVHWVPMLFVAGFLVVVGVNAVLIFFAEDTFSGLETQNAYERGLDYNKALDGEAAQERLAWQYQATVSDRGDGRRMLRVRMMDHEGRPLDGLKLDAYLVRPSNEGMDLSLVTRPIGDGAYAVEFALPAPGQWDLRLVAHRGDVAWQYSERLFLK